MSSVRPGVLAIGLALLASGLACSGGAGPPDAPPLPTPAPAPAAPVDPTDRLTGTWQLFPDEINFRRLKVIDAAIADKPQKIERLGVLTPEEQKLFDTWKGKTGPEAKDMRAQLRFMRNTTLDFAGSKVTVHLGADETYGPVEYAIVSATETDTTLTFDPNMGNGVETHHFHWESARRGTDDITADGRTFPSMTAAKK